MLSKPTFEKIIESVDSSIGMIFKNDIFLLEIGVHERTVAHKLAEYLQVQFPDWHVDCEYNRDDYETKVIMGLHHKLNILNTEGENSNSIFRESKDIVYPDIIIHQRGQKNNLLVIEMKTNQKENECDIEKLTRFTKDKNLKYLLGLFLQFNGKKQPQKKWFHNGKHVPEKFLLNKSL